MEGLFTMDGVNYVMAVVAILAFALLAGVVVIMLNDTARKYFQKAAFPLLLGTAAIFVVVEVFILMVPGQAYEQGYNDAIGRPDAKCPVFRTDANGDLMLSDETGNPEKNQYKLVGRPVVIAADGEIHLWVSNRDVFEDGTHLCTLPLTANNAKFAQKATEAWDNLHGEPGSGEELQDLREQAERNGQGQSGQQGGQQGQGREGQVPDIIIELPNQQEDGEGQQGGDQGDAQQQGGEQGEGQPGEGNMPYDQQSEGSVTIRPPEGAPDKRR